MRAVQCIAWILILFSVGCVYGGSAQEREPRAMREHLGARMAWELERLCDPQTGTIPVGIKARELEFAASLPVRAPFAAYSKNTKTASLPWVSLGPHNIGGRTRAIAIDKTNANNILVGSASGGVWRSIDAGGSWVKTSAANDVQSVSCLVQDVRENHTSVWYYGTGELLSTTDRRVDTVNRTLAVGNGIFKSTDNGASWQHLASTKGGPDGRLEEHFQAVWDIAINPANSEHDELYAACYGAIMRSLDGGTTWSVALGDTKSKAFGTDIAVSSGGVIYAGLGSQTDGTASPKQGVWRSGDGQIWVDITPNGFPTNVRTIRFALAPSNENALYILTETPLLPSEVPDPFFAFAASQHTLWKYIYASGDGTGQGGTWENLSTSLPKNGRSASVEDEFNTLGGYCMLLAVQPNDENIVFLGGTNLFRVADGFASQGSLNKIGGYFTDLHPDMHCIAFPPNQHAIMYVGHDAGVARTENNAAASVVWSDKNNGYVSTQFYSVCLDHTKDGDNFVMGGLQDNGTVVTHSADGKANWQMLLGGDGCGCAVVQSDKLVFASAQAGNMVGFVYDAATREYDYSNIFAPHAGNSYNFYTMPVLEPTKRDDLYLPARHRLLHVGSLGTVINGGMPNWDEVTAVDTKGASITALGASVVPAHRLYVGTNNGQLLRVDNANTTQPSAENISAPNFPKGAFVGDISVDPTDANRVLVAFSNYNVQSLFYTVNGGATWDAVGGNLEGNPDGGGAGPSVHCVQIVPTASGMLYLVGTTVGLFSTDNMAGTQTVWQQEGATSIGNVQVEAIDARLRDGRIVVATYGNGVFTTQLPTTDVPNTPTLGVREVYVEQNYPNPVHEQTSVRFFLPTSGSVSLMLYDALGKAVATLANTHFSAGEHIVEVDTKQYNLVPGTYFYRLQVGGSVHTKTLTVAK